MRVFLSLLIFTSHLLLSAASSAAESGRLIDAVSVGYGEDNINNNDIIYFGRIGLQNDFNRSWFETDFGHLNGYVELAFNRWSRAGDTVNNISISPFVRYQFDRLAAGFTPYVYLGLGVSYGDETEIGSRDLSSEFLFEESFGFGARSGRFDFSFGAVHYSNANLEDPNDGMTAFFGKISYRFP